MSLYLQPSDYAAFGVQNATANQVLQASNLIDAFLNRPAGLLFVPDSTGNPCYMANLSPIFTFTAQNSFGPGQSVTVQVTGAYNSIQVGDCLVCDRANPAITEIVQVTSIAYITNAGGEVTGCTLTLGSTAANVPGGVMFAHANGSLLESDLAITEERHMPKQRPETSLSNRPVQRVVGGTGRYGYGRRGEQASFNTDVFNLLAALQKYGGPPAWEIWPSNVAAGIDVDTGRLWVPAGIMIAYYSDVKVRYIAGWMYQSLPMQIKLACASLIIANVQAPIIGAISEYKAGDTAVKQFASTLISDDVKSMLRPYQASFWG